MTSIRWTTGSQWPRSVDDRHVPFTLPAERNHCSPVWQQLVSFSLSLILKERYIYTDRDRSAFLCGGNNCRTVSNTNRRCPRYISVYCRRDGRRYTGETRYIWVRAWPDFARSFLGEWACVSHAGGKSWPFFFWSSSMNIGCLIYWSHKYASWGFFFHFELNLKFISSAKVDRDSLDSSVYSYFNICVIYQPTRVTLFIYYYYYNKKTRSLASRD